MEQFPAEREEVLLLLLGQVRLFSAEKFCCFAPLCALCKP